MEYGQEKEGKSVMSYEEEEGREEEKEGTGGQSPRWGSTAKKSSWKSSQWDNQGHNYLIYISSSFQNFGILDSIQTEETNHGRTQREFDS